MKKIITFHLIVNILQVTQLWHREQNEDWRVLRSLTEVCGNALLTLVCKSPTSRPSVWTDFALFWSASSHPESTRMFRFITLWHSGTLQTSRTAFKKKKPRLYLSGRRRFVSGPLVERLIAVFLVPQHGALRRGNSVLISYWGVTVQEVCDIIRAVTYRDDQLFIWVILQHLKCEDLLLFFVLRDDKLNVFWFWTLVRQNKLY